MPVTSPVHLGRRLGAQIQSIVSPRVLRREELWARGPQTSGDSSSVTGTAPLISVVQAGVAAQAEILGSLGKALLPDLKNVCAIFIFLGPHCKSRQWIWPQGQCDSYLRFGVSHLRCGPVAALVQKG